MKNDAISLKLKTRKTISDFTTNHCESKNVIKLLRYLEKKVEKLLLTDISAPQSSISKEVCQKIALFDRRVQITCGVKF